MHLKRKGSPFFRKIILLLAVLAAGAVIFLTVINRWSVTVTLQGEDAVTVEYGDRYQAPGAQARLHGSLLFREGWPVEVNVDGSTERLTLGRNILTYSAEAFGLKGSAQRVITVVDTQAPEITLSENADAYILPGETYQEEGFTATDNYDGDLTAQVEREEKDGIVTYTVTDSSGNTTQATRVIRYLDTTPPKLTLNGGRSTILTVGAAYEEPGCTAIDDCYGDLTSSVEVSGGVDTANPGIYTVTYTVTDRAGNTASAERTVVVNPVPQSGPVTPEGKVIYLTFDDGPGKYTQKLLDVLDKYGVKATFFTVNTRYIDLIQKEAAAGHTVAIHSASHKYQDIYASEQAYFDDLVKQQKLIYEKTGILTTLVRLPGGSGNTISRRYCEGIMTTVTEKLTERGYQYFDWNVVSGDAGETTSTEQVYQNVISGIKKHDISIVLQHDIKEFSIDAVERIIVWGLENGYTFLPLDAASPTSHQRVNN